MASSSSSIYFSTFATLALLFFSTYSKADLISKICAKSVNEKACNSALRSDPHSKGADLRALGQIIIKKSISASKHIKNIARTFKNGASKTCIEVCRDAIDNLNDCVDLMKKTDKESISTLQTIGSAALTDISTCDDEFGESEPSKLKQASETAQDLIDVLLVIANTLNDE